MKLDLINNHELRNDILTAFVVILLSIGMIALAIAVAITSYQQCTLNQG